jgi:DNA-directed RNA polymerase subunit RPC12/RpoP
MTATESIRCPESGPSVTSDFEMEHSCDSCAFARVVKKRTRRPGVKRIRTIIGALTVHDRRLTPAALIRV